MYSGYKVISCKQELISILNKMKKLGYRWGSGEPLDNSNEIRSLMNTYKIGEFALVFSRDTKQIFYCRKAHVQYLNIEGQ